MSSNSLQDPIDALRFVVEFAQTDLLALTPTEYLDLVKQVRAFLVREGAPAPGAHSQDISEVIEELQRRTFQLLSSFCKRRSGQLTVAVAGDLRLTFWAIRHGAKVRVVVGGSTLHRMLYQTIQLLGEVGADKLLKCSAPDCGRLFVKVTKKEYCSTRCQSRVYMRRYRSGEVGGE